MNIAFDSFAICGLMGRNRGIGNYALDLFKTMIQNDVINKYYFVNFFEDFNLTDHISSDNLTELKFSCGRDLYLLIDPYCKEIMGDIIRKIVSQYNIDVYMITSPFENGIHVYQQEWFYDVYTAAIVYDIIPFIFRDKYFPRIENMQWYLERLKMLNWIDRLLVISESVKNDLMHYLKIDETRIQVIWGASSSDFRELQVDEKTKVSIYKKYGILDRFIMCTGGDDERKNIKALIIAYSNIPATLIQTYQLVIVCKLSDESYRTYDDLINNCHVQNRVILTNFVENEDLHVLYNLAYLMAFPSLYEGFGLPVVEAFACGTPVLTSNNSSLGQIAQNAAVLVDPFQVQDITRGLVEALTKADLSKLIENGYEKLKTFNWDNVSGLALSALSYCAKKEKVLVAKRKIAFFTPLPPLESGISDYSVDILNSISQYYDIDVFIDDEYSPECILSDNITVHAHKFYPTMHHRYDDTIYQVGNFPFHEYMFQYIRNYGGTLVLHDYNMHNVFHHFAISKQQDLKLYKSMLLEDFNKNTVNPYIKALKKHRIHFRVFEMELNGYLVNCANKIIVHSDNAKQKLLNSNISRNVKKINHYASIEPLVDPKEARDLLEIKDNDFVFSSFGFIHNTKRAIPILKAFEKICNEFAHVRFIFVGELYSGLKEEFDQYIKDHQCLQENVIVTGYTNLEMFNQYIDAVDVCVNLRYPYGGETSGSLMRILAKGKCSVVNNIGSFSEVPSDCCIKIPSVESMSTDEEIAEIYEAMKKCILDLNFKSKICKNARRYAQENLDIQFVTKKYLEFINMKYTPALDEQLLSHMKETEILPKNYTYSELQNLSATLAYTK